MAAPTDAYALLHAQLTVLLALVKTHPEPERLRASIEALSAQAQLPGILRGETQKLALIRDALAPILAELDATIRERGEPPPP